MRMLNIRLEQKNAKRWLSLRIVTYLIEYLGEFEFIFKTILDHESRDQMGSFDAKRTPSKISCLGTFKRLKVMCFEIVDLWIFQKVSAL
jgi:hypothetical protein